MDRVWKRVSAAAAAMSCAWLSGCATIDGYSTGALTAKATPSKQVVMGGDIAVKACETFIVPPGILTQTCPFSDAFNGQTRTSGINLSGLPQSATVSPIPVMVFQVPADAVNFFATYDDGGSRRGTLVFTPGNSQLAIDATTNLVAEAGMQLVVMELPASLLADATAKAAPGTYHMVMQYNASTTQFKIISSAKVTAGGRTFYPPQVPCVTSMSGVPEVPIPATRMPISVSGIQAAYTPCSGKSYAFDAISPGTLTVVEFYNPTLDHYFITWIPAEIANLDAGLTPTRWLRTNKTFKAFMPGAAGTSDICRFYIPPILGDSHFFGRGTAECNATAAAHPTFVLEDPRFMGMVLPTAGVCPPGTIPVYRVFSNRGDANHRYMIDRVTRDQMVALHWLAEGDGPDLVVMCAPA